MASREYIWLLHAATVSATWLHFTENMNTKPQLHAFDDIESNHKTRAAWILDYLKRKKKEDEIKQKEAIEQKLDLMDDQDIDSQKSDESEQDQQNQKGEVSDAVDGLLQY